ncbi:unnamed protein product [Moneuplotes crassus]|uniref:Uncharacterized protein n=1 Tax=Euplotes crassus TaxID=5936 RepID=A0AAD1Y2Z6_EUPCR|nr:unnamed protein product [Moneuplotes crassus]
MASRIHQNYYSVSDDRGTRNGGYGERIKERKKEFEDVSSSLRSALGERPRERENRPYNSQKYMYKTEITRVYEKPIKPKLTQYQSIKAQPLRHERTPIRKPLNIKKFESKEEKKSSEKKTFSSIAGSKPTQTSSSPQPEIKISASIIKPPTSTKPPNPQKTIITPFNPQNTQKIPLNPSSKTPPKTPPKAPQNPPNPPKNPSKPPLRFHTKRPSPSPNPTAPPPKTHYDTYTNSYIKTLVNTLTLNNQTLKENLQDYKTALQLLSQKYTKLRYKLLNHKSEEERQQREECGGSRVYYKGVVQLMKEEFKVILEQKDQEILVLGKENQGLREILGISREIGTPKWKEINDEIIRHEVSLKLRDEVSTQTEGKWNNKNDPSESDFGKDLRIDDVTSEEDKIEENTLLKMQAKLHNSKIPADTKKQKKIRTTPHANDMGTQENSEQPLFSFQRDTNDENPYEIQVPTSIFNYNKTDNETNKSKQKIIGRYEENDEVAIEDSDENDEDNKAEIPTIFENLNIQKSRQMTQNQQDHSDEEEDKYNDFYADHPQDFPGMGHFGVRGAYFGRSAGKKSNNSDLSDELEGFNVDQPDRSESPDYPDQIKEINPEVKEPEILGINTPTEQVEEIENMNELNDHEEDKQEIREELKITKEESKEQNGSPESNDDQQLSEIKEKDPYLEDTDRDQEKYTPSKFEYEADDLDIPSHFKQNFSPDEEYFQPHSSEDDYGEDDYGEGEFLPDMLHGNLEIDPQEMNDEEKMFYEQLKKNEMEQLEMNNQNLKEHIQIMRDEGGQLIDQLDMEDLLSEGEGYVDYEEYRRNYDNPYAQHDEDDQ